jgi:uncharacterized protein YdhG (YjbR/CyaY superfamily)
LEEVRRTARAAAPQAEEVIAYNMPALRLNGRFPSPTTRTGAM